MANCGMDLTVSPDLDALGAEALRMLVPAHRS